MKTAGTAQKRNGKVDLLRFVFAIIIMLHHSRYVLGDENCVFLGGSLAVEFFFIISGYFLAVSTEKEDRKGPLTQTGSGTWQFLKRKISGFMPEFVIAWIIGFIFVWIARGYHPKQALHAFKDEIFEVLLLKMSGIYIRGIDGVTWYLSAMVISMAVLYPLLRKHRDVMTRIVCPLAAVLILGYFCRTDGHPRNPTKWLGFMYKGLPRGFAELCLGITLSIVVKRLQRIDFNRPARALLELFEFLSYIYFIRYMYREIPSDQDYFFILLLFVALSITLSGKGILTEHYETQQGLIVTGFLAKYSSALFFAHIYFAQNLNRILPEHDFEPGTRLAAYIVLSFANGLVVMLLAGRWRKHREGFRKGLKRLLVVQAAGSSTGKDRAVSALPAKEPGPLVGESAPEGHTEEKIAKEASGGVLGKKSSEGSKAAGKNEALIKTAEPGKAEVKTAGEKMAGSGEVPPGTAGTTSGGKTAAPEAAGSNAAATKAYTDNKMKITEGKKIKAEEKTKDFGEKEKEPAGKTPSSAIAAETQDTVVKRTAVSEGSPFAENMQAVSRKESTPAKKNLLRERIDSFTTNIKKYQFMFEELVKRDFKQRYKRSILGMAWSILSPLLTLLVMRLIFTEILGRDIPHYTIYLFSGNIVMSYFRESTRNGMRSLTSNAKIFTKINVPKYLFLLSKNVSALVNFGLTLIVYFVFCLIDHITFTPKMVLLIYPSLCLLVTCIGIGAILSAMYVFFEDTSYLYDVVLTLLNYMSAIFYTLDRFDKRTQNLFLLNPVYVYIKYFRVIVIDGVVPSLPYHLLCLFYPILYLGIGMYIYKKYNSQFLYYL